VLIVAACIFYFPTTMVLMYCYGTIFHASKSSLVSTRKLGQQHHYDLTATTTTTATNALLNKDGYRDQLKVAKQNKNGNVRTIRNFLLKYKYETGKQANHMENSKN